MILHGAEVGEKNLPKLAVRPYPTQYVWPWKMKDGTEVTIRPIRPEDEPLMIKFHETLSDLSVYTRYFYLIKLSKRVAHERLTRICFIDYDREMRLVADRKDPETGMHQILGLGGLTRFHGTREAEFALLVSDQFQGQGLGTELLRRLVEIGRAEKLRRITADILPENTEMQRISKKIGFRLQYSLEERVMKAEIDLS